MIKTKKGKTTIGGNVPEIMSDLAVCIAATREHLKNIGIPDDVCEKLIQRSIEYSAKAKPDGVDG